MTPRPISALFVGFALITCASCGRDRLARPQDKAPRRAVGPSAIATGDTASVFVTDLLAGGGLVVVVTAPGAQAYAVESTPALTWQPLATGRDQGACTAFSGRADASVRGDVSVRVTRRGAFPFFVVASPVLGPVVAWPRVQCKSEQRGG